MKFAGRLLCVCATLVVLSATQAQAQYYGGSVSQPVYQEQSTAVVNYSTPFYSTPTYSQPVISAPIQHEVAPSPHVIHHQPHHVVHQPHHAQPHHAHPHCTTCPHPQPHHSSGCHCKHGLCCDPKLCGNCYYRDCKKTPIPIEIVGKIPVVNEEGDCYGKPVDFPGKVKVPVIVCKTNTCREIGKTTVKCLGCVISLCVPVKECKETIKKCELRWKEMPLRAYPREHGKSWDVYVLNDSGAAGGMPKRWVVAHCVCTDILRKKYPNFPATTSMTRSKRTNTKTVATRASAKRAPAKRASEKKVTVRKAAPGTTDSSIASTTMPRASS